MQCVAAQFDALSRAVSELEALEAIYGFQDGAFEVVSPLGELAAARSMVETGDPPPHGWQGAPRLEVAIIVELESGEDTDTDDAATRPAPPSRVRLRCGMPAGYPGAGVAATVFVEPLGGCGLRRAAVGGLRAALASHAEALCGDEAVMELVQRLQELGSAAVAAERAATLGAAAVAAKGAAGAAAAPARFGRRWLWMHHIKAVSRRAQMMGEAAELGVGGLIKPGYPGVCVLEGAADACDEYIVWLKGVWIGRVVLRGSRDEALPLVEEGGKEGETGEVGGWGGSGGADSRIDALRRLPARLEDLGEGNKLPSMGVLGQACRGAGLSDEFMEYIMQHRAGGGGGEDGGEDERGSKAVT